LYTIAEMNVLFEKVEEKYLEYILSLRYLLRVFFKVIIIMIVGLLIQLLSLKITLAGVSILFSIIMLGCYMVIREKVS
ncbi:MAG: hypothetical protein PUP91_30250, partial [Rhizonema sp. PD37]|nr:hypothetical protein [Rhizonema sp. PD37]